MNNCNRFKGRQMGASLMRPLWKGLKSISILIKKENSSLKLIKWNIKQKCVGIGNSLASVNSRTTAHLPTVSTNSIRSLTCQIISKLKSVNSFMSIITAIMETGVNSYIHNSIFWIPRENQSRNSLVMKWF